VSATVVPGPWGLTWTIDEPMCRTSHALAAGGRVWLVDPVADEEALAAAERLGEVAGVIQLLDRHRRDAEALAARYGVEHHRLPDALPGTPFALRRMVWLPVWKEQALWWEDTRTYLVTEAVGTIPYFAVHGGPLGMHPLLRPKPPGALRAFDPDVLLCGHGGPLTHDVPAALDEAIRRSRRDMPKAALGLARLLLPGR
jgi:hypothetical protein